MSNRYKGAVISATPPTTSGGPSGTASGAWTLEQQMQLQAASLWPSQPPPPNIEDVFSTFLYTGTGAAQTITNNIDLSTKGGLVWGKQRSSANDHFLINTILGSDNALSSNLTSGNSYDPDRLTAFTTSGFSVGTSGSLNTSAATFVSWTFREQPKFFDVVTYTGNGTASRAIPHNLGSAPGMMIVKQTDGTRNWPVYHRSVPTGTGYLNLTSAFATGSGNGVWGDSAYNNIAPTSTVFYVGSDSEVNGSGLTYVAYLFAHDAGGFGLTETDNVISCGSYTTDGSGAATVNLGYEPQWLLIKKSGSGTQDWHLYDTMRGFSMTGVNLLRPNLSAAETAYATAYVNPTSTGFNVPAGLYSASVELIYIAIRRGPMKVPTVGTSVFSTVTRTGTSTAVTVSTGIVQDLTLIQQRSDDSSSGSVSKAWWYDRLRGGQPAAFLTSSGTDAEGANSGMLTSIGMNTYNLGSDPGNQGINVSGNPTINWNFKRAPGFFDEVCYTGTGVATTFSHNLTAVPELMIVKVRSNTSGWQVYASALANTDYLILNTTAASVNGGSTRWNSTTPTSTVFSVGTHGAVNGSGDTYVAYLFATLAGVSKVGSYTGTGTTQTINCGFTAGSRFVLIKRTDSTGDWYVWDSARGIIAGNDPYLLLNSTAAEVTSTDYIDTAATGFEISSTAPAAINASAGTYIFLAIA